MATQHANAAAYIPEPSAPIPVGTDDIYGVPIPEIRAPVPVSITLGSPEFKRAFRFGVIDNAVLVAFTLMGLSIDDYIADAIGVPGYGAIMGATIGNAISDGVAGLPEGRSAAIGYLTGALLPGVPLAIALMMKKELSGTTKYALLGSSVALFALAFARKNGQKTAG